MRVVARLPVLLLAALLAACAPSDDGLDLPPAEANGGSEQGRDRAGLAGCWHVVHDGETLRSIARHYYGSGRLWRSIQVANDVGQEPDSGRRLWIPGYLPRLD